MLEKHRVPMTALGESLRAGAEERKGGGGLKAYYIHAKIPMEVDTIDLYPSHHTAASSLRRAINT